MLVYYYGNKNYLNKKSVNSKVYRFKHINKFKTKDFNFVEKLDDEIVVFVIDYEEYSNNPFEINELMRSNTLFKIVFLLKDVGPENISKIKGYDFYDGILSIPFDINDFDELVNEFDALEFEDEKTVMTNALLRLSGEKSGIIGLSIDKDNVEAEVIFESENNEDKALGELSFSIENDDKTVISKIDINIDSSEVDSSELSKSSDGLSFGSINLGSSEEIDNNYTQNQDLSIEFGEDELTEPNDSIEFSFDEEVSNASEDESKGDQGFDLNLNDDLGLELDLERTGESDLTLNEEITLNGDRDSFELNSELCLDDKKEVLEIDLNIEEKELVIETTGDELLVEAEDLNEEVLEMDALDLSIDDDTNISFSIESSDEIDLSLGEETEITETQSDSLLSKREDDIKELKVNIPDIEGTKHSSFISKVKEEDFDSIDLVDNNITDNCPNNEMIVEESNNSIEENVNNDNSLNKMSEDENLKYVENELLKYQTIIKNMRDQNNFVLKENIKLKKEFNFISETVEANLGALEEAKLEVILLKKRKETDLEQEKINNDLLKDKNIFLNERIKSLVAENEILKNISDHSSNGLKVKERELESKIEMLKIDSESKIKNREEKIINLKQTIDQLEFNFQKIKRKDEKIVIEKNELEIRLSTIMRTLKGSIQTLEEDTVKVDIFENKKVG